MVTPDGIIHTAAGTGDAGFSGDAGLATQATFRNITAVAVGADDTIYVVDQGNNRVRWFRIGGPIFTLAGTGISGTSGDGGLALDADLQGIDYGLAVGPDRGVYVSSASARSPLLPTSSAAVPSWYLQTTAVRCICLHRMVVI